MKKKIAINGLGRIGRMVLRGSLKSDDLNIVAINASYPPETIAHLIKYDSTHGKLDEEIKAVEDGIVINDHKILLVSKREPKLLPWGTLNIDIVIEATGKFNHGDKAVSHIDAGAKKVILTGPAKGGKVQTIVIGLNDNQLNLKEFEIISISFCTKNCLSSVAKVLSNKFCIENGLMKTVHAFKNDQKNLDNPHKELRRPQSSTDSIIPSSNGA